MASQAMSDASSFYPVAGQPCETTSVNAATDIRSAQKEPPDPAAVYFGRRKCIGHKQFSSGRQGRL